MNRGADSMLNSSSCRKRASVPATFRRDRRWARRFSIGLEALEDRVVLSFTVAPALPGPGSPSAEVAADFDGNGKLDLAVTDEQFGGVSVYTGNGDGTFQPRAIYPTDLNPNTMAVGDLNGDGRP